MKSFKKGQVWKKDGIVATVLDVWDIYNSVVIKYQKGSVEYEKLVRYEFLKDFKYSRTEQEKAPKPKKKAKALADNITVLSLRGDDD